MSSLCIGIKEELVVIWPGIRGQLDIVLNAVEVAFLFWLMWSSHVSWKCMVSTVGRLWAEQPRNLGGINQPGHEADYAPPSLLLLVSRLTLDGALPPLPYALYDVHRDSFTFTLMCSNHESIDNVLKPAEGLIRVSCWVL